MVVRYFECHVRSTPENTPSGTVLTVNRESARIEGWRRGIARLCFFAAVILLVIGNIQECFAGDNTRWNMFDSNKNDVYLLAAFKSSVRSVQIVWTIGGLVVSVFALYFVLFTNLFGEMGWWPRLAYWCLIIAATIGVFSIMKGMWSLFVHWAEFSKPPHFKSKTNDRVRLRFEVRKPRFPAVREAYVWISSIEAIRGDLESEEACKSRQDKAHGVVRFPLTIASRDADIEDAEASSRFTLCAAPVLIQFVSIRNNGRVYVLIASATTGGKRPKEAELEPGKYRIKVEVRNESRLYGEAVLLFCTQGDVDFEIEWKSRYIVNWA